VAQASACERVAGRGFCPHSFAAERSMKVFFDIDTQLDFIAPGGALYGAGAERLIPVVAALNRYAGEHAIPLISTTDAHPENAAEFRVWPPHCVAGTFGQQKPAATLLQKRAVLQYGDNATVDYSTSQIIVEKNDLDMFTNPHLLPLLSKLDVTECIVYGIFVDYCVKCAIMGLLRSGRHVSLVTDASASISPEAGDLVIREFLASGGHLIASAEAMS
jgi:nicotinamidase/pyrazinamidase